MNYLLIAVGIAAVVVFYVLILAMCKAAADADRQMEKWREDV